MKPDEYENIALFDNVTQTIYNINMWNTHNSWYVVCVYVKNLITIAKHTRQIEFGCSPVFYQNKKCKKKNIIFLLCICICSAFITTISCIVPAVYYTK